MFRSQTKPLRVVQRASVLSSLQLPCYDVTMETLWRFERLPYTTEWFEISTTKLSKHSGTHFKGEASFFQNGLSYICRKWAQMWNLKCGHCLTCGLFVIHAKNSQLIKMNDTIQWNMPLHSPWSWIVQNASNGDYSYYKQRSIGAQQPFVFTTFTFAHSWYFM